MATKYVYFFGNGKAEGKAEMKNLLGGKGANLAEMTNIKLPVPPGFTITTELCTYYYANKRKYPKSLEKEVLAALAKVERAMGAKFGDPKNPLLVSIRSGARASMPGMMDTILNLGLNDKTVIGIINKTKNERFAYDSYRRFVQMYGDVVLGLKPVSKDDIDPFEVIIEEKKREKKVKLDTELTADDLKDLVDKFKKAIKDKTGNEFRTRTRLVAAVRRYLDSNGFLEVETPILQPIYGGAAARPFTTFHNQLEQELFLRISFELYLKRLIVGGFERVYEIGRDFRNEGISFKHNPEFTQLEFYEAYTDYNGMMRRTEEMVCAIGEALTGGLTVTYDEQEIDLTPPWRRITMRDAICDATGIDYTIYPDAASLAQAIKGRGLRFEPKASRGKLIDGLFGDYVEPSLIQPTFIMDYPLDISPLAKKKADDPTTVERFEYFIAGMEMGNAFTELNDPIDQRARFVELQAAMAGDDENVHPLDEDFLNALSFGMPPTGGFGTGIDRLTMLFTDRQSIREVILFPHLRSID